MQLEYAHFPCIPCVPWFEYFLSQPSHAFFTHEFFQKPFIFCDGELVEVDWNVPPEPQDDEFYHDMMDRLFSEVLARSPNKPAQVIP